MKKELVARKTERGYALSVDGAPVGLYPTRLLLSAAIASNLDPVVWPCANCGATFETRAQLAGHQEAEL